jgi:hypothetical protein
MYEPTAQTAGHVQGPDLDIRQPSVDHATVFYALKTIPGG